VKTRGLVVELPDDLVALLGSPEAAAARAKESLVLDLLRGEEISQGKASELLGITRWDVLDLMARYKIESGPKTAEEARQDVEVAERAARPRS
jgi:predicted HTH domain antitoxin